jgi:hypothetical protein
MLMVQLHPVSAERRCIGLESEDGNGGMIGWHGYEVARD